MVEAIKTCTKEERYNAGNNTLEQLIGKFQLIWDDSQTAFFQPLMIFLIHATKIACFGLETITKERRDAVIGFLDAFPVLKRAAENGQLDLMFDTNGVDDDTYDTMVTGFLSSSLEPLTSDYPNILFTWMICVACADQINEKGLEAIAQLREDYIEYALRRHDDENATFTAKFYK